MNANFDKSATIGPVSKGNVGAAAFVIMMIFLERLIHYAFRSSMSKVLLADGQAVGGYDLYFYTFSLSVISTVLIAIMMDHLIERRTAILVGGLFLVVGLALILVGGNLAMIFGLGIFTVGSGACRIGGLSYLGYLLPPDGRKIEGGYVIAWTIMLVAALFSTLMLDATVRWIGSAGSTLLILLFAILNVGLLGLAQLAGWLPRGREGDPLSQQVVSKGANIGGIIALLGLVLLVVTVLFFGKIFGSLSEWLLGLLRFGAMVLGFLVFCLQAGPAAARRNGILAIAMVLVLMLWTSQEMLNSLGSVAQGSVDYMAIFYLGSAVSVGTGALMALLLLLTGPSNPLGYSGTAQRIGLGTGISLLAMIVMMLVPISGVITYFSGSMLTSVGEAVVGGIFLATVWRISPHNAKSTGIATFLAMGSFSNIFSNLFSTGGTFGFEPESKLIVYIGATLIILVAIAAFGGLWAMLRKHQDDAIVDNYNPFD